MPTVSASTVFRRGRRGLREPRHWGSSSTTSRRRCRWRAPPDRRRSPRRCCSWPRRAPVTSRDRRSMSTAAVQRSSARRKVRPRRGGPLKMLHNCRQRRACCRPSWLRRGVSGMRTVVVDHLENSLRSPSSAKPARIQPPHRPRPHLLAQETENPGKSRGNLSPMTRLITIVGEGGLEPPRPEGHWHLKPARLPFRHSPERPGEPITAPGGHFRPGSAPGDHRSAACRDPFVTWSYPILRRRRVPRRHTGSIPCPGRMQRSDTPRRRVPGTTN